MIYIIAKQVIIDLSALQRNFSSSEITLLTADGPLLMNSPRSFSDKRSK